MLSRAVSDFAGEWYLGVYCRRCKAPIPVFRDLGGGEAIAAGTGKLTVACPSCGKRRRYRADAVMSFLIGGDGAAVAPDRNAPAAAPIASGGWADPAKRPELISGLQPMLRELKARAESSGRDVLARVAELFADYLAGVPPERQKPAAIEQYLKALFVLSRGSGDLAPDVGEELVATLSALNRRAGLSPRR
ncbi:MAG TPA: hypothetical protein VGB82_02310 [Alphaproteobacteria bacterium]